MTKNSRTAQDKVAEILRASKSIVYELADGLQRISCKVGVFEKIVEENEQLIKSRLSDLKVNRHALAHEVYDALISKIEADDLHLVKVIGHSSMRGHDASVAVINFTKTVHPLYEGFFLKIEKAKQFMIKEPPKKIMTALGYSNVEEMVAKEDIFELYSALRFLEDQKWQNKVFFKQYEKLKPSDFEVRKIQIRALGEKWTEAAEKFVRKKYHNISHLKELGVVFVIPIFLGISGETLRLLSLVTHYLHEISYYSDLFIRFSKDKHSFSKNVISVLRGDVLERRLPVMPVEVRRPTFLVLQRYLAKDDENDWRLFEPRINPEALHWRRAEEDITKINHSELRFWLGLDWVGDFFKTREGNKFLVSFDLVDTVMALVKQKELIKYLYHQQEALWNQIFIEHFGVDKLEEWSKRNIVKGWFEI